MAARSIASLSVSFGLVSIPVKLYSATESSSAIQFKLLGHDGAKVRQQYVRDAPPEQPVPAPAAPEPPRGFKPKLVGSEEAAVPGLEAALSPSKASKTVTRLSEPVPAPSMPTEPSDAARIVERAEMLKGYEFEKGRFVTFTPAELKALQEGARETIDIVSFIPERSVDPIYFDKAYYLAPDKRGGKPYSLLLEAMRTTGRVALAKWAFRSKEYVVQIRPIQGGLVLQQMLYGDEVRSIAELGIDLVVVGEQELKLAQLLIQQSSTDSYEPGMFVDEEKRRILAAVEEKIAGRQIVSHEQARVPTIGAKVIDLVEALRASLVQPPAGAAAAASAVPGVAAKRKPSKRTDKPAVAGTTARARKTAA
jgi:DNA end-binding protein Ku